MPQSDVVTSFGWATVRDQLQAELETLSIVRLVNPFVRFDGHHHNSADRFRKKHIPDGGRYIDSFTLRRISEDRAFLTAKEYQATILVGIDYFYEMDDDRETQVTFDENIDIVLTHFQEPIRLEGRVELMNPMQLVTEDWREFADRLVHHAEFQTEVQHIVYQSTFR